MINWHSSSFISTGMFSNFITCSEVRGEIRVEYARFFLLGVFSFSCVGGYVGSHTKIIDRTHLLRSWCGYDCDVGF